MKTMNPTPIDKAEPPKVSTRTVQISEADYTILLEAKKRNTKLAKEQRVYDRNTRIKGVTLKIGLMERELEFKKEEFKRGESLEKHTNYKDDIKPIWFIQNEIEQIELQLDIERDNLRKLKEEQDKDVGEH